MCYKCRVLEDNRSYLVSRSLLNVLSADTIAIVGWTLKELFVTSRSNHYLSVFLQINQWFCTPDQVSVYCSTVGMVVNMKYHFQWANMEASVKTPDASMFEKIKCLKLNGEKINVLLEDSTYYAA